MNLQNKRLFISNLPDDVTQSDIESKFSKFGNVIGIEIKQRKNIVSELFGQTSLFAYVQISISKRDLRECLQQFVDEKWNGYQIDVQEARESFIERLKREREEQRVCNGNILPSDKLSSISIPSKVNNKKYDDSEDAGDEQKHVTLKRPNRVVVKYDGDKELKHQNNGDKDDLIIKKGHHVISKGILRIPSVGKEPIITIERGKKHKTPDKNVCESDKKRIQSFLHMRKEYQQQKSFIKKALSNVDSKLQNKIIFNDDIENETKSASTSTKKSDDNESLCIGNRNNSSSHLQLFEDAQEEENYNFEVREHFEGRKGQRLMELQSKFKSDKRFIMDARFLEQRSDDEQEHTSMHEEIQIENDPKISLVEEKQKQFDILEEVLGTKVSRKPVEKTEKARFKMMLRFDPSQPEHSKYEIKEQAIQEKRKKKRKDSEEQIERKTVEDTSKPEVSKDTFYKVTVDLKNTFEEKEGFSLASLFNSQLHNEILPEKEEHEMKESSLKQMLKKSLNKEQNPFKYDSSSDESEKEKETPNEIQKEPIKITAPFKKLGANKLWTESFFFKNDDYRLQEGIDFIKRLEVDDQENFSKLRRNLHEIIKAKVRNTQRKNRPFKRKLGGKKRIRIKRAMKR